MNRKAHTHVKRWNLSSLHTGSLGYHFRQLFYHFQTLLHDTNKSTAGMIDDAS